MQVNDVLANNDNLYPDNKQAVNKLRCIPPPLFHNEIRCTTFHVERTFIWTLTVKFISISYMQDIHHFEKEKKISNLEIFIVQIILSAKKVFLSGETLNPSANEWNILDTT